MTALIDHDKLALIDLENVWAGYEADTVLEDVNFRLFENDYVGLIGPNGGGKTTLIKVILGLVKPTRGRVTVMGRTPEIGRHAIGYVPQIQLEDRTFPISVWDVVSMGRLKPGFLNLRMDAADKQAIEIALKQTGMLEFARRSMNELSGGQRQRVYISRALVTAPKILLLDEPTASIDDVSEKQLIDHLKLWLGQRTMIVATHRRAVLELVDRIIVVNDGKIVMDGPRDQILNQNQPQQRQVAGANS